jgi:hypothetical protein
MSYGRNSGDEAGRTGAKRKRGEKEEEGEGRKQERKESRSCLFDRYDFAVSREHEQGDAEQQPQAAAVRVRQLLDLTYSCDARV